MEISISKEGIHFHTERKKERKMLKNKRQHSYTSVATKEVSERNTDRERREEGHSPKGEQRQMAANTN